LKALLTGSGFSSNDRLMDDEPPGAWRTLVVGLETFMLVLLRVDISLSE
jgi:hypothetical protein